ncbi:Tetraspanin/Peripherin [Dimargaris cristalligena]|uniref:Tetraspanin/Peripherin n=1 Tax=Dimargaris cristalligena TaxID=215637 RepID=A0A4P9ZVS2_9FUNG|nr:Tetraspanin/Peripherin [Dimargaris cristalligena]|eukprot:RKP37378.1 Tetraspanin/Peripherin [Dimargaris cristalligena]
MTNNHPFQLRLETARLFTAFFSVLVSLSGLALVGLAIYTLAATHVSFSGRFWIPIFMLIMGALVFFTGLLGSYGSLTEKRYATLAYSAIMTILLAIQLVVALYAIIHQLTVEVGLDAAWQNAYDRHPKIIRDLQDEYGCCGFKNVDDRAIPKSSPQACVESPLFGYNRPCYDLLQRGYQSEFRALIIGEFILIAVQALALLCGTALYKQLAVQETAATPGERQALLEEERRRS